MVYLPLGSSVQHQCPYVIWRLSSYSKLYPCTIKGGGLFFGMITEECAVILVGKTDLAATAAVIDDDLQLPQCHTRQPQFSPFFQYSWEPAAQKTLAAEEQSMSSEFSPPADRVSSSGVFFLYRVLGPVERPATMHLFDHGNNTQGVWFFPTSLLMFTTSVPLHSSISSGSFQEYPSRRRW